MHFSPLLLALFLLSLLSLHTTSSSSLSAKPQTTTNNNDHDHDHDSDNNKHGPQVSVSVTTPDGPVTGFLLDSVRVFRGLPYAAPPTGTNRLRPPQPVQKWTEPREAVAWGASCLQLGSNGTTIPNHGPAWNTINVTVSSEDCLYLNVYAPGGGDAQSSMAGESDLDKGSSESSGLPVMVYFHAGEFLYGTSNDAENAFPYFAKGRVILVTANARLGLLGFAALEELRERDPSGSSGNYGVQDQRAVMQWVQRSISAFGGDPSRVTIFGESSGGSSVGFHLSSKASAGLFSGAILESPGLTQSKMWEESRSNTLVAVASLAASKSPKCTFPANATPDTGFQTLPGVAPYGLQALGKSFSLEAARQACLSSSECLVVATESRFGVKTHTYMGPEGDLREHPVGFFNETVKLGPDAAKIVITDIRLPDMHTAVDCLLAADAGTLVAVNESPPYGDTIFVDSTGPTVDGVELTQPLIHQSTHHPNPDVAILGGANLDEGTEFMMETPELSCNASDSDLATWCSLIFSDSMASKVPSVYNHLTEPTPLCRPYHSHESGVTSSDWVRAMRAVGDFTILCPTRYLLNTSAAAGQKNVFWYHFEATPIMSLNSHDLQYMGAFHGAEVPFVFGDQFELSSDGERSLSAAMGCYWTNFATTGNPNEGSDCAKTLGLPLWPALGSHGAAMIFRNTTLTPVEALKEAACDLFAASY